MRDPLTTGYDRFAAVAEALSVEPLRHKSATELATTLGITRRQAHDALRSLEAVGWADQDPATGNWRLSTRLTQIAYRLQVAIGDAHKLYLEDGLSPWELQGIVEKCTKSR